MKKIIALALALMMILSLSVTAYAADDTGTITINGVSASSTYEIYHILTLESYNVATGAYDHKVGRLTKCLQHYLRNR